MREITSIVTSFAALCALAGCASSNTSSPAGGDAGEMDGASPLGASCTPASIPLGPEVTPKAAAAATPPAMTGGTIADGTYFLVASVLPGGLTGGVGAGAETIVISGSTLYVADSKHSFAFAIAPSGNQLNPTSTCPGGVYFGAPATYTATATELQLYSGSELDTFQKQ